MIVLGKNWNQVEITGQTIRAGAGALLIQWQSRPLQHP